MDLKGMSEGFWVFCFVVNVSGNFGGDINSNNLYAKKTKRACTNALKHKNYNHFFEFALKHYNFDNKNISLT